MMHDLLESESFKKLEQEYKFLSRAREQVYQLENDDFVILDTETTGLDPANSEIIEIAALKVKNKEIVDIFNHLVKPANPIPDNITKINGITNEMVEESPTLGNITYKFLDFIGGSTLMMHNAEFDLSFINHHIFTPRKKELGSPSICTLKVSRFVLPQLQSHKLSSLAQHFGIPVKNSHRALGDVETTFELWFKLTPLLRDKGISTCEDLLKAIP
ncbi:MAG: 3'-5' exonuclease [Candidatus Margulisiibacteriota bacterium]